MRLDARDPVAGGFGGEPGSGRAGGGQQAAGAPTAYPRALRIEWLRGLVRALDQRKTRGQSRFVIKFSSWSVTELALIREAFPEVPTCFLFRDPVEVMVSLRDDPPSWLTSILQFETTQRGARNLSSPTLEECSARLLAHFCRSALSAAGQDTLFLNYRSLPAAVWGALASHFSIGFAPGEIERMSELAQVNAKDIDRVQKFAGDSSVKQARASDLIRRLAATWTDEPYQELERRAREGKPGESVG